MGHKPKPPSGGFVIECRRMAFDEQLAKRIQNIVGKKKGVMSKQMFGGIAFMLDGKMFVGVVGDDLMVRVGKEQGPELLEREGARPMDFTGKPMAGYLYVDETGFRSDAELEEWIGYATRFVKTIKK